jgi:hypothetical protein
MVIIDPEGMFCGDRMAQLSDETKLLWPWLYLASNGYARIEINYRKMLARVFSSFRVPPTEAEFMKAIQECAEAYLLFLYQSKGAWWGQWDTSAKYLPRHQTASDKRSPDPPPAEFTAWKEAYAKSKESQVPALATFSEIRRNPPKSAEIRGKDARVVVGVGVGVVAGVGVEVPTLSLSQKETREPLPSDGVDKPKPTLVTRTNGDSPEPSKDKSEYPEEVEWLAERLIARHPRMRRCGPKEAKDKIRTILRKRPKAEWRAYAEQIDKAHEMECRSDQWRKADGEYAKGLSNWLSPTMGRFEAALVEHAEVMDEEERMNRFRQAMLM